MKNKNIAFSGVMAAILLSAGAASAATTNTKIASEAYVKGQVSTINTNLTENYYNKTQTDTAISNAATQEGGAIKAITDALSARIKEVADSTPSEETLANKADRVDGVTAENAGGIATVAAGGNYEMSTTKLSDLATTASVATAIENAVKADGAIDTAVDTKITEELGTDGAISGAIDTAISDSVKEDGAVYTTMIPRPKDGECSGDSDMCVLSVDKTTGALTWVNVTNPLE